MRVCVYIYIFVYMYKYRCIYYVYICLNHKNPSPASYQSKNCNRHSICAKAICLDIPLPFANQ